MKKPFLMSVASSVLGMFSLAVGQVGSQAPAARETIAVVENTQSATIKQNTADNCGAKQVKQSNNDPESQQALVTQEKEWEKAVHNQ